MKKRSTEGTKKLGIKATANASAKALPANRPSGLTIGLDLGDRMSQVCILNGSGEIVGEERVATTKSAMTHALGPARVGRCRIALEVGTHSPWVSRCSRRWGTRSSSRTRAS